MENRITKQNGTCEYIDLDECTLTGELRDNYKGAGVALIACKADEILDLEYLTEDPWSNLKFCMKHFAKGNKLFIGMCSCCQFCEPQELITGKKFSFPSLVDQIENHMRKHNLTMVH